MLSVQNLNVTFNTRKGDVDAVKDISFNLKKGEILGIVGESGSGKSVTSYALMRSYRFP
jgi:peptide/nickel transport system ATP-binding protein